MCCPTEGGWVARHNALRDALQALVAARTGDTPAREVLVPAWRKDGEEAVLDLALADTGEFIDVTVCHPCHRGSADNDGAAARAAEERQRARYPGGRLVPAALETHGRAGEPLAAFLRRLHGGLSLAERAAGMADAWATLSATLQRGNANLLAMAGRPPAVVRTSASGAGGAAETPRRRTGTRTGPY